MKAMTRIALAALAVAGSSAALAQSSVTLYGRINTSVEREKIGDTTTTKMNNNASRFGFKGVEDLGGGLKAGFQLESGFDSSTGAQSSTSFFGRQSEVNLSGNFGMLRMGRWIAESYFAVADYGVLDAPNYDTGNASDALYGYLMRDVNKVAYRTPLFAGLTVEGALSMHERQPVSSTIPDMKNAYDLAVNWEGGPLALGAGYTKVGDANQFGLRAHYTWGPFQIAGYYQHVKNYDNDYLINAGSRDVYRITGGYTFGASDVALGFAHTSKLDHVANSDANQVILGYNYNFSKRTKVYAIYTHVDNKAGARYATGITGANLSTFGVGMAHNF
ncbi:porin [Extensimonas perlucida]|uniref:porin n=1 Tax=Extensimonas perlucida TaxID=2590786 RepID=UPI0011A1CD20|nr:porin [Extensimonas perlucida]